ncbi:uncharacterized protein AB675_5751 [Cyphellophora attinorum]|uniref:Uncharacterized protein n=1 Tax=Cyphellophora attinorum TaxID=1664694 RepID=A0A0N1HMX5_9EURO|nr:uncharacterized protein AB675_5751 [Phialophora attinorum]KPI38714.1 hypothetical protein AB675_5751 [Phialophora attinorum]
MLALKGDLGALRSNPTKRPITVTVLDLPAEVLSLIVEALYYSNAKHGRVRFLERLTAATLANAGTESHRYLQPAQEGVPRLSLAGLLDGTVPEALISLQELVLDTGRGEVRWYHPTPQAPPLPAKGLASLRFLRRLAIIGDWNLPQVFDLDLPALECLRIAYALQPSDPLHPGFNALGPLRVATTNDNFKIDFASLPRLRSLHIEGIRRQIPIENIVGTSLTSLTLHRHPRPNYPDKAVLQRSPGDLAKLAILAPQLRCLQLDIGNISKLWNSTSVPGVDVDVELYSWFAALADLKHLRTLRLFPPYKSANVFTAQGPLQKQPLDSDSDAVAMFLRLRAQNASLNTLVISPSDHEFHMPANVEYHRRHDHLRRRNDFHAMAWEMYAWGESTILTTRQARKRYCQRQVWVGNRRLRSEILRDSYAICDNVMAGGALADDEEWTLDPVMNF